MTRVGIPRIRKTYIEVRISCGHWVEHSIQPRKRDFVYCPSCKDYCEVIGFGEYDAECENCEFRKSGITSKDKAEHQGKSHAEEMYHRVRVTGSNIALKIFDRTARLNVTVHRT